GAKLKNSTSSAGEFLNKYFLGNRNMGAFVLAMTTIATYGSVSSFVGGPGQAWNIGWGWVYMATVQVTTLYLLYGILGKKMALVSRKLGAVTVVDVIRERFNSPLLGILSALIIVVFFITTMIAQFVGGAKLFEAVTGQSYVTGLIIFGVAALLFTVIGGFRGVVLTDALAGIIMLVGIVVLAGGILHAGDGFSSIMQTISETKPHMMEPLADGTMPVGLYFTQWLLVGIFTFALPQSVVRTMGYKDTKSLHRATLIGTIIIGVMMIGVTSLGVLAAGVLTDPLESYGAGTVDDIIPQAIITTLPSWLASIAIVGPVAASISTVSSLLISATSALVKDIWLAARPVANVENINERSVSIVSRVATIVLALIVVGLSITPPSVIWKINMFAFGGLETAFAFVLLGTLFWKRATKIGALTSMIAGVAAYVVSMALGFKIGGLHQITIGLSVALLGMVIGSLLSKKQEPSEIFFPEK
ncbi:MAG: sodium/pantothenate symporter, partial [Eggerthellaceae bacterium]|nr:sodium/pantothenate symporter [Eggerthellaceae bacterium]